ncbi:MAG: SDR family oxidoreductase [Candidatus Solibacter usitatus]|nr:SDR family oxidoreductase [Candidatus Solibacter usitatus]
MQETLNGLEIVLAGGSGGLGSATARLLADEGARLVVSYHSNAARAAQLQDCATVLRADLTRAEDRTRLLNAAPNLYGLVVLSGDPSRVKDPLEFDTVARHAQEVNYLGPIQLAREAAARMRSAGTPGSIVLFSTMQAVSLFPGSTAYAAAKASLQHAARVLAKECRGKDNIRVNVIAPGATAAGMAEASIASGKYNHLIDQNLIPRFGRAIDIARAVRFFLQPDNYITGQVLSVDGGVTL